MSDQPEEIGINPAEPATSPPKGLRFPLPSWNKLGEFLINIMQLERSVETLKEQNKELNKQVLALQRQVYEQSGELKVLVSFVHTSLRDQIDTRAERAAIKLLERMNSVADDSVSSLPESGTKR
jgi:predicted RNase H-like nuclease (RuvC/YqgF family)